MTVSDDDGPPNRAQVEKETVMTSPNPASPRAERQPPSKEGRRFPPLLAALLGMVAGVAGTAFVVLAYVGQAAAWLFEAFAQMVG
ncbi:MAG: hypothetical protein AAF533_00580 [Acidobacteriota bacterium]